MMCDRMQSDSSLCAEGPVYQASGTTVRLRLCQNQGPLNMSTGSWHTRAPGCHVGAGSSLLRLLDRLEHETQVSSCGHGSKLTTRPRVLVHVSIYPAYRFLTHSHVQLHCVVLYGQLGCARHLATIRSPHLLFPCPLEATACFTRANVEPS